MMIRICQPDESETRAIQERERAFYWSRCAGVIFHKRGVAAAAYAHARFSPEDCAIVLRGSRPPSPLPASAVFEGPLSPELARTLELTVEGREYDAIECFDADLAPLGALTYARIFVKRKPATRGRTTDACEYRDRDPRWKSGPFAVQFFAAFGSRWRPVAYGRCDGELRPLALSDGRQIAFGLPVFDILAFNHAMPALDEAFYQLLQPVDVSRFERWLVRQVAALDNAEKGGVSAPAVWPDGYRAAFSIRHDYDRLVPDDRLRDVLDFYAGHGLRATWCLLVRKPPPAAHVDGIVRAGHEIALHTTASSREAFLNEVKRFEDLVGFAPRGFTCHGGVGSGGFLGLHHARWAMEAGMLYGEMPSWFRGVPSLAIDPDDGAPAARRFVVQECHRSLDVTTKPDGHQAGVLRRDVPQVLAAGEHAIVMSHPDIHWDELRGLIEGFDLRGTWRCTLAEAAEWVVAGAPSLAERPRGICS